LSRCGCSAAAPGGGGAPAVTPSTLPRCDGRRPHDRGNGALYGGDFADVLSTARVWVNGERAAGRVRDTWWRRATEVAVLPPVSGRLTPFGGAETPARPSSTSCPARASPSEANIRPPRVRRHLGRWALGVALTRPCGRPAGRRPGPRDQRDQASERRDRRLSGRAGPLLHTLQNNIIDAQKTILTQKEEQQRLAKLAQLRRWSRTRASDVVQRPHGRGETT